MPSAPVRPRRHAPAVHHERPSAPRNQRRCRLSPDAIIASPSGGQRFLYIVQLGSDGRRFLAARRGIEPVFCADAQRTTSGAQTPGEGVRSAQSQAGLVPPWRARQRAAELQRPRKFDFRRRPEAADQHASRGHGSRTRQHDGMVRDRRLFKRPRPMDCAVGKISGLRAERATVQRSAEV
jgi:hypothetical protein